LGDAGFSPNQAGYISLALDPTRRTAYALYADGGHSAKATVREFNDSARTFVVTRGFSAMGRMIQDAKIKIAPGGAPRISFLDFYDNQQYATMMRYDGAA
jgi:hypothetical protein